MTKERMPLFAEVEVSLAKRFRKRLIDDGLTFKRWLIEAITNYLDAGRKNSANAS